jgi:ankyrin repeat protein
MIKLGGDNHPCICYASKHDMKHILITTIAAVFLMGCGKPQQSATPEAQPVEPVAEVQLVEPVAEVQPAEPVTEAAQPEPPLVKLEAPDISIHEAIKEGDIQAVKQHLATGTDVNAKDERGGTALYSAAVVGLNEIAELLINKGADVRVKNKASFTPLHEGAYNGHKEIVELLITSGADVNAMKIDGMTPLDMATFGNHYEIIDLLRKHGGKTRKELKAEGK